MTGRPADPRRLAAFALVGTLGFVVDAGLTAALVHLGAGPLGARLVALPLAIIVTFALNRRLTFPSAERGPGVLAEFARYLGATGVAAAVNYVVYAVAVASAPAIPPALAVAIGSAAALLVSYCGYDRFVFRRRA